MNQDQIIIAFGEALCRQRALTDQESRYLERAIRREDRRISGPNIRRWTPQDDRELLKAAGTVRTTQIAEMLSRSPQSVSNRLCELRKAQVAAVCVRKRARKEERV